MDIWHKKVLVDPCQVSQYSQVKILAVRSLRVEIMDTWN